MNSYFNFSELRYIEVLATFFWIFSFSFFIILLIPALFKKKNLEYLLKSTLLSTAFGFISSVLITFVASIFYEYPKKDSKIYYFDYADQEWKMSQKGVFNSFKRGFVGYNIKDQHLSGSVELHDKSPFTLYYKVEEDKIFQVLKNIGTSSNLNFRYKTHYFIKGKSYELFFKTPHENLLDDKLRLEVFQRFYSRFGITVTAVNYE